MLVGCRFKYDLDDRNAEMLTAHLSPNIVDSVEQGWEECTFAAMTHLLRTSLAKTARDTASVAVPLEPLEGAVLSLLPISSLLFSLQTRPN